MCNRYDIAGLQKASEMAQISRRSDGTLIYRIGPTRWVDAVTLEKMLVKLAEKMEELRQRIRNATAGEVGTLRAEGTQCQLRLMNYQTGLAKIKGVQHEHVDR